MGDEITLPFTFAKPAGDSHFPQWSSFTIVRASDLSPAKLENVTYHSEVKHSRAFLVT